MTIVIRSEQPSDYAAIAAVHCAAFGGRVEEALIVALQRQRPGYDPALALVAERDGRIVGHALFMPEQMQLGGQTLPVVNLAPIGVLPTQQRAGIGGALLAAGHRRAADAGYAAVVLVGHPTYYPRFGYQTQQFGHVAWSPTRAQLDAAGAVPAVTARAVTLDDLPALHLLWQTQQQAVDYALQPDPTLVAWCSPNPALRATVYVRDGRVVGYTRCAAAQPDDVRWLLAADVDAAVAIARRLAADLAAHGVLHLPLHPAAAVSAPLAASVGCALPTPSAWQAAMALPLNDTAATVIAAIGAGQRLPGQVIWGSAFDLG